MHHRNVADPFGLPRVSFFSPDHLNRKGVSHWRLFMTRCHGCSVAASQGDLLYAVGSEDLRRTKTTAKNRKQGTAKLKDDQTPVYQIRSYDDATNHTTLPPHWNMSNSHIVCGHDGIGVQSQSHHIGPSREQHHAAYHGRRLN